MEPFVIRHYSSDERPTVKGNGFDGLEIGETREEAETFIAFVNAYAEERVRQEREACANIAISWSDKSYEAEQIAAEIQARSAG